MKGALVLLVTIVVVCLMIRIRYRSKKLQPKAQLVCDIWNAVEGSKEEE